MYELDAHDYMISIGSHSFKQWKEPVLQLLTPDEHVLIQNTKFSITWQKIKSRYV